MGSESSPQAGKLPEIDKVVNLKDVRQEQANALWQERADLERQAEELRTRVEEMKKLRDATIAEYEAEKVPQIKEVLFGNKERLISQVNYLEGLLREAEHLKNLREESGK